LIFEGVMMNSMQLRLISAALFFLFVFLSGFWLKRTGMPYSTVILTVHKLIALGAGVFLTVTVYRNIQLAQLSAIELTAIAVSGLLFVGTIVTGGLVSIDKPMPAAVLRLHQITPFLTVLATAVMIYFLLYEAGSSVTVLR
jgi:hypothetical protein